MRVRGRLVKKGAGKLIFKDNDGGRIIEFDSVRALPLQSPLIEYDLEITGGRAQVLDIVAVTKVKVSSDEIRAYYNVVSDNRYPDWVKKELEATEKVSKHLELLKYFNAEFILGRSPVQLERYAKILKTEPWKFCFWSLIEPSDRINFFFPSSSTAETTPLRSFQKPFPLFTPFDLNHVCQEKEKIPEHLDEILQFYYLYYKRLYYDGVYVALSPVESPYVMEFSKKHGIFVEVGGYLIDEQHHALETKLANHFRLAQSTHLIQHVFRDREYGKVLSDFIRSKQGEHHTLCFCQSPEFTTDLTGIKFLSPYGTFHHSGKKRRHRHRHRGVDDDDTVVVIIEGIHTLPLEVVVNVLDNFDPRKCQYFLIGDLNEISDKSGGALMHDLHQLDFKLIDLDVSVPDIDDKIAVPDRAALFQTISTDYKKRVKTIPVSERPNTTRIIFSMDHWIVNEVAKQIDAKSTRPTTNAVHLKQQVVLPDRGIYGTLTSAFDVNREKYVQFVASWQSSFTIVLDDNKDSPILLAKNERIARCDIFPFKSFSGPSRDFVYFIVSPQFCTREDIIASLKYAKIRTILVFIGSPNIVIPSRGQLRKRSLLPELFLGLPPL